MRTPSHNSIIIKEEELRLVRRPDSKRWQAHYKIGDSKLWIRRATGTSNLIKATALAERFYMKAVFDHKEGRPIHSRKFKAVAITVLNRLLEEIKVGTSRFNSGTHETHSAPHLSLFCSVIKSAPN
jgi:integrase